MQCWESSQAPTPTLIPGAVLAWSRLGLSAEHCWCGAGHRGRIQEGWGGGELLCCKGVPAASSWDVRCANSPALLS